ncbi:DUF2065 domain-containing protein [Silvimonas iriomotensis]|uniref:DUF2065 domain-containing protein n=1 Tax=Silvimonas iriomotensis TaxID=449662 RepID=A0ABQ2P6V2_9NEIS|nr:DUF2065 domain-containing protein [Silvimonas iriomotensis]GGP19502.1 hypothetical protein GCM10010970_10930 [Silvimonas iriomotensis]
MGSTLWQALVMVLVLEGLMPFAFPGAWRKTMARIAQMHDLQIRLFGLALLLGAALVAVLAR